MSTCWEWEPAAMRGEPVPKGLGLIERLAYYSMRGIYAQYQSKRLTKEEAKNEKAEIQRLCRESTETIDQQQAIFRAVDAVLTDTADLRRKIRTATDAQEVALLGLNICSVLEGRITFTGHEALAKAFQLCGMEDQIPIQQIALF